MRSKLHRFTLYLLLMLLPFQALAAVRVSVCAMPHYQAMRVQQADCCEHGVVADGERAHVAPCAMGMASCAAAAPFIGLPSALLLLLHAGAREPPSTDMEFFYISVISDGLKRPPRFFA